MNPKIINQFYFLYNAIFMNKPKCPKGKSASTVCVTETCKRYPFICNTCEDLTCQRAHQFCKTMLWESALERIYNYHQYESKQFQEYVNRVEKIFDNIIRRVRSEKILFKENIEEFLYGSLYQKIKRFIQKEEYAKIQSKDIGDLISKMTTKVSNYELESFYVSEMKSLDTQITSLFQSIEKMYKKKITIPQHPLHKDKKLNSLTQSMVLKKDSSKIKVSNNSLRKQSSSTYRIPTQKEDLSYPQHIQSKVICNAAMLNYFLGTKVKSYKLLYRGSQNSFQIQQFYKKCANSTSTMILAKTEHGKVVGGYTKLPWRKNKLNFNDSFQSGEMTLKVNKYKEDVQGSTIFFSVDLNEKYQLLEPKFAIYCGKNSIGFGKEDLRIINHAHKHNKNFIGFPSTFNNGLYLPVQKSSLILSGSRHSHHFKIKEWQAFQVIFSNKK